jgi:hypothetical protein
MIMVVNDALKTNACQTYTLSFGRRAIHVQEPADQQQDSSLHRPCQFKLTSISNILTRIKKDQSVGAYKIDTTSPGFTT